MSVFSLPLPESDRDRRALEALVVDNPDLEYLETLLDHFNIFDAMGVVRHELRHSDLLAFLLNPRQSHGLADAFLKQLLQQAIRSVDAMPVPFSPIDLDIWNLSNSTVIREWQNIDILVLNEEYHLAIIVENKIDSIEHSDQCQRYRSIVERHYPHWKIIGLFLTPDRTIPSDTTYLPIDYGIVCTLVDGLTKRRASTLGADVATLLQHYVQMLRRHILNNSEIAELCQRIYQRHQRALDLIYEHRPDRQAEIRLFLEERIGKHTDLTLDYCTKSAVRFAVRAWDDLPALRKGTGWTPSGRILLFEWANNPDSLTLRLQIGPGPLDVRQRLFMEATKASSPIKTGIKTLGKKWGSIYHMSVLHRKNVDDIDRDKLEAVIDTSWSTFIDEHLPAIQKFIASQDWLKDASHNGTK